MLTPRLRLVIATLILGPILTYWGLSVSPTERRLPPPAELEKGQDFFATGVELRTFNEQGSVVEQLTSPRLDHYPNLRETIAQTPALKIWRDNSTPVTAQALIARLPDSRDQVILAGDARVQHNAPKGGSTDIRSETLLFYPEQQVLKTNKPVTIAADGVQYQAVGLEASLKTRTYQLLSNVRGTHQHEN